MRKRKEVRERICKLPWRHQDTRFNVVRLGHQVPPYVHGHLSNKTSVMPSLFAWSPSCVRHQGFRQAKAKWRQVTKTRPPPPSLSKHHQRHRLHYWSFSPRGVSFPAQSVVASPHQVGGSHDEYKCLLAAARLLSRELSQELIPNQALSTLTSVLKPIWCTMKLYGGWRWSLALVYFLELQHTQMVRPWGYI